MGRGPPAVLLRQAASRSGGLHQTLCPGDQWPPDLQSFFLAKLMFNFLPSHELRRDFNIGQGQQLSLEATCSCHGRSRRLAWVCSCCLSLYCSDEAAMCPTCFRPPIAEDRQLRDLREPWYGPMAKASN